MNYSPAQYARALLQAREGAKSEERSQIVARFLPMLSRHRALGKLSRILCALNGAEREIKGTVDVLVESAAPFSPVKEHEIREASPARARVRFAVRPTLLAGLTITINDEIFIDASGSRQLQKMLPG